MISVWPTARTSSTRPLIRMKSQAQSSNPPIGRSRPPRMSRWGSGAPADGCERSIVVAMGSYNRSRVCLPMIATTGIMQSTNSSTVVRPSALMWPARDGNRSISVIFRPLSEW